MMRKIVFLAVLAAAFLTGCPKAEGQSQTTVSATVTDPNGVPYAGGTVTAVLSPPGLASPCVMTGGNCVPISGSQGPSLLDSTGSFTLNLYPNASILCGGAGCVTQWSFRVCISPGVLPPLGTGPQCFSVVATIAGSSQSLSSALSLASPALAHVSGGGGFTPGGDLSGGALSQNVIGFHFGTSSTPLSLTVPSTGSVLQWNGTSILGLPLFSADNTWTGFNEFTQVLEVDDDIESRNLTPATVSNNAPSTAMGVTGNFWNGTSSVSESFASQLIFGSGANPSAETDFVFNFQTLHLGTTGPLSVKFTSADPISPVNLTVTGLTNSVGGYQINGAAPNGQCLIGNGAVALFAACPGGGGSPGGSATQIQFNNSGAFGGAAGTSVTTHGGAAFFPTADTPTFALHPFATGLSDPFQVFNETAVSVPSTPSTGQTAGGTLGARTDFTQIAYADYSGTFTTYSTEHSQAVSANNLLTVTSPAASNGAAGWLPAIASATGTETKLETVTSANCALATGLPENAPAMCAIGATFTEPTTGFNATGPAKPASNLTQVKAFSVDSSGNIHCQNCAVPVSAGFTASAGTPIGVDSTTGLYHYWNGAADKIANSFTGSVAGTAFQDVTETAGPGNPASGNDRLYLDSTSHQLTCLTSAGGSCMPSGGSVTGLQFQVVTMTGTNTAAGNANILTDASNDLNVITPVASAAANSPTLTVTGVYQNSATPTFAADSFSFKDVVASGLNGSDTLTLTQSGTSGTHLGNFSSINGPFQINNDWIFNGSNLAPSANIGTSIGGFTASGTNTAGSPASYEPSAIGTGNSGASPVKIKGEVFSATSGTASHSLTDRAWFGPPAVAGSTTSGTADTVFTWPSLSNDQTDSEVISVSVEAHQAGTSNCETTGEFSVSIQDTGGTVSANVSTVGLLSTICTTGTLTWTASVSAANPPVLTITPSWTTIVPTAVTVNFNRGSILTEH